MQNLSLKEARDKLKALLEKEAFKKGNFILSSGRSSNYYLDGRIITLTPEGSYLAAGIILEMVAQDKVDAIGGPTLGADPIAGAVAALSYLKGSPLKAFIVRKKAKEHGMQRQVEGPAIAPGSKVVLVDDVATTGKAIIEAKEILDKAGVKVARAIVIVDREEGATANLAGAGLKLESIFTIKEFL
ncbi:MAG: orotate phosphoribosyltransferase [Candidatus Omnitrophota bacterium]